MSRIRANTLALGLSFFVTAILAFIQVKIVTNHLTQELVGVWSAALGVGALLMTLTELGLPQVLVRFGAKFDAEGRRARLSKLLTFALKVHFGALAVMLLLLIFLGPMVAGLLGGGALTRNIILIGYLAMASGTIRALNNASFRGLRRMSWVAWLEILFSAVVTLGYFLLRDRLTVELVLGIFWGASVLSGLIGMAVLMRILRGVRRDSPPEALQGSVAPEVRGYWQGAAAAGIFLVAIESVDKPLLAGLVSFEALAVFHVVARLALFARRFLYVPLQVMNPEVTHKWEGGRREDLHHDMRLFIKLELGLGLLLIAPLALFAKPLLLLVSTPEFLSGAPVLWAFTAAIPLLCLHQPLVMFLRAVGHVWVAFAADAIWLTLYLGLGSILVGFFGLPGFVSAQVVASTVVLSYTLMAFSRLGLPRPSVGFMARRVVLAAGVWGACLAGGNALPADLPVWMLPVLGVLLLLVANVLMVRGGYLNSHEEQRAISLLAGRGLTGRLAAFFFSWPRGRAMPAILLMLALTGTAGLTGCGDRIPPGCSVDEDVPAGVRRDLEAASRELFARIEAEDAAGIFNNTVIQVRSKGEMEKFLFPMVAARNQIGVPETLTTTHVLVAHFAPGYPVQLPLPCTSPDGETDEFLVKEDLVGTVPLQASLIQEGESQGILMRYSSLWFMEEEVWKLAAFDVRAARVADRDWQGWEVIADQQMAKGNQRNAALLYNLALDLMVPAPWIKPSQVAHIEERQGAISVSHLPSDRLDPWRVGDTTFGVYRLAYVSRGKDLGLVVNYNPPEGLETDAELEAAADRLAAFVKESFPEYAEVFTTLILQAVNAQGGGDATMKIYPLRDAP